MKVYLENRGHENYYHWMIYIISCFLIYNYENDPEIIYSYLPEDENSFNHESLRFMFPNSNIKNLYKEKMDENDNQIINLCKECNEIYCNTDITNPIYYNFLRNKFSNYYEDMNIDYVFISRKISFKQPLNNNKMTRHIKNEDELMKYLEPLGFKYILLEEFTLKQKIGLFKNAKMIISPWSAALTNCLFSSENTKIIQVCPPTYLTHYIPICNLYNIPIYRFEDVYNVDNDHNFDVNINSLVNFIKPLL